MDDDNYVNPRALLQLLKTFPRDRDVYVGKPSLNRPIHASELQSKNRTVCPFLLFQLAVALRGGPILGAGPVQEAGPGCLVRPGSSCFRLGKKTSCSVGWAFLTPPMTQPPGTRCHQGFVQDLRTRQFWAGAGTQLVKRLPSRYKALGLIPSAI